MVFLLLALIPLVLSFLYFPQTEHVNHILTSRGSQTPPRLLLLTAHPDDESFFFSPTILSLLEGTDGIVPEIFSLCLSNGDADGLGKIREQELADSLAILGVEQGKHWVLDHPELQDNITLTWDAEVIVEVIQPFVTSNQITAILTFDFQGISSHPNHRSLPAGALHLRRNFVSGTNQTAPRVWSLVTVPLLPKYTGLSSAVLEKLKILLRKASAKDGVLAVDAANNPKFVSGLSEYVITARSILAHASQIVWYRRLNMLFSRYMWVNEWIEL
ncbi:N-acetylglucosaminylphosphatidylinositoldeacety la se [Coniophora puteana RWD-64-598 SS2]|uniref:N-acetylglucosaminylphosphatidylinositol deacetylase n=1 Tax=Coniophora puteana (strain RWD-64-598) TaxID=741705 RepID=A0A5M3MHK2_CONPW|nr:N-acetylglucosaminylphosphatidylinositoldeacety la se [Coniophora puteana RWD-64-598 SS2]EIW78420.1 N-acetylglucosaminylphosphatidylinositoldeacety la se [Coniophora puteana RWD-64-598 SS2]